MYRRAILAALAGAALSWAAPAEAQARRSAERAAKKSVVERKAVRAAGAAEDLVMRLVQTPPERRRDMLENNLRFQRLPMLQRRKILSRLEQIDAMPPEDRARLVERYHMFSRLAPEKRERARELYREWAKSPAPRRQTMTRTVARLRRLEPDQRAAALESAAMTERFDERERRLIGEVVEIAPGPAGER